MSNLKHVVFARRLPLCLIGIVAFCIIPGDAEARSDSPWTTSIYVENDLFAKTDRNYTNGFKFSWISPDLNDYSDDENVPGWTKPLKSGLIDNRLTGNTLFRENNPQHNLILSFRQNMYTPGDDTRSDLIIDDRPYAAWLYLAVAWHSKTMTRLDSLELDVGVVGPAAFGHEIQDIVHDIKGVARFNGWDNQLENELGLNLIFEHKRKFYTKGCNEGLGADVILHGGFSMGNIHTYANTGLELRAGWKLPMDFGTSIIRPGGDNSAPLRISEGFGLHVFAAGEGRAVARDIFLDGNTFRDSHSVDKKDFVADVSVGLGLAWKNVKLTYGQVYRTKEFKGQDDEHTFGSLTFSFSY